MEKEEILKYSKLLFDKEIDDKTIELINQNKKLKAIEFTSHNYENIKNVINEIKSNTITYIIWISNIEEISEDELNIFKEINNKKRVKISSTKPRVSFANLDELIKGKEILDLFVKDIKNSNLSPLEKYLCAYNITKKFKEYKEENEKDLPSTSRNVYKILFNNYMVCVGYSELLKELLNRLGIKSIPISINIIEEEDKIGHQRNMVYINDPKYNIDGIFFADACWDSDYQKDLYIHSLITEDEIENENIEYDNNLLNILNYDLEKFIKEIKKENLAVLLYILRDLEIKEFNKFKEQYEVNPGDRDCINKLYLNKTFLMELYNIVNNKFKKEIDKNIIYKACQEIDKFIYKDIEKEELDEINKKRIEENVEQRKKFF